jgi:hypothetical protein
MHVFAASLADVMPSMVVRASTAQPDGLVLAVMAEARWRAR